MKKSLSISVLFSFVFLCIVTRIVAAQPVAGEIKILYENRTDFSYTVFVEGSGGMKRPSDNCAIEFNQLIILDGSGGEVDTIKVVDRRDFNLQIPPRGQITFQSIGRCVNDQGVNVFYVAGVTLYEPERINP